MSNSLTELNNFSNQTIIYSDQRPYQIVFSPDNPSNVSVAVDEDVAFLSPVGTDIENVISVPSDITYNINLSNVGNIVSVDWAEPLPLGLSISNIGNTVYTISGVFSKTSWEAIRNPEIILKDTANNFTYTANIQYPDPANVANVAVKSWSISASVTASDELSQPTDWAYVKNFQSTVDGVPIIVDPYTGSETYTMTVSVSSVVPVSTLSTNGSGGTSIFDNDTKTLVITGTKEQVNSHLQSILFTPVPDVVQTFDFEYQLVNPITELITTRIQPVACFDVAFSIERVTYVEDTAFDLEYTIVDQSATAESYTISIEQSQPSILTNAGMFSLNGSNVGSNITWTGTREQINSANVWYYPPVDWVSNISLSITQTKVDNGETIIQEDDTPWTFLNSGTNPEIANMSVARGYFTNTVNDIFPTNRPVITDGPSQGQIYTITFSSSLGKFGNSAANALASSSTYSFTGSMEACNAEFAAMKFLPNQGISPTNGYFTYTQSRDGVLQVNQNVTLIGSAGASITPKNLIFTSNGTYTPTIEEVAFGTWYVLSVGGGGGGAALANVYGGGGAGGQVAYSSITINTGVPNVVATLNVNIGAGGAGVTGSTGVVTGATGGNSYVTWNGTTFFTAAGGAGGTADSGNPGNSRGGNLTAAIGGTSHTGGIGGGPGVGGITGGGGGAGSGSQPGSGQTSLVGTGWAASVGSVSYGGNGGGTTTTTSYAPGGWTYTSIGGGGGGGGNDIAYGIGGGSTRVSAINGGNGGWANATSGTSALANKGGGGGGGKGGAGNGAAGRIEIKIR